MTVFKDTGRIRKVWHKVAQTFRRVRSEHDQNNLEQQQDSMEKVERLGRKRPYVLAGGALAILAIVGFSGSQYVKANTVDYYEVYRNGSLVGEVSKQEQVEQLVSRKQAETEQSNPNVNMVLETGTISYELKSAFKADPDSDATLRALEQQFTTHALGVELTVNGKVVGIVKDQETAEQILERVKSQYAPQQATAKKEVTALAYTSTSTAKQADKPTTTIKSVHIVENIAMNTSEVRPDQIAAPDQIYATLVKGSAKETKYTVQEGDCIGCIAQKFDISPQVIYERNKWIKDDEIKVGDVLDLTVLKPQVTVQTIENITEIETIEPIVQVKKNASMRAGQTKVIREGQNGKKRVTYKLVKQNGYLMSEEFIREEVLVESVPAIVMKGTKVVLGEGTGKFSWPVVGARLTSSFGKRWGRQHKGIDMVGNKNILAADHGVIEFAGTKNGLGRCVIINHKNGYKTTYAHLSRINVNEGQIVEQGDKIGIMGNTGHSFGTHLHFEIRKNGELQNPMKYL